MKRIMKQKVLGWNEKSARREQGWIDLFEKMDHITKISILLYEFSQFCLQKLQTLNYN